MSDSDELRFSQMRGKRGQNPPPRPPEEPNFTTRDFASVRTLAAPPPPPPRESEEEEESAGFKLPVDQMRLIAALKRRWIWIVVATCLGIALGFAVGLKKVPYKVNVTFIRPPSSAFQSGLMGEDYRPEQLSIQTLASLTKSPELIHRVATNMATPISEHALRKAIEIKQTPDTELIVVTIPGKAPRALEELVTNYIHEVVLMGRELQVSGTVRMNSFYKQKIVSTETELNEANQKLTQFNKQSQLIEPDAETQSYVNRLVELKSKSDDAEIELKLKDLEIRERTVELAQHNNPTAQKLAEALNKRADLLATLTEEHPSVKGLQRQIDEMKAKLAETNSPPAGGLGANPVANTNYNRLNELQIDRITLTQKIKEWKNLERSLLENITAISTNRGIYLGLKSTAKSLEDSLIKLRTRQRAAQLYEDEAPGYFKLVGVDDIDLKVHWIGMIKFTLIGCFVAGLLAAFAIAGIEVMDDSLKTTVDVERVTELPILATLGDLSAMSPEEQDGWAFRTWTALSGQLSPSPNHGMVCGFISSLHGEGRSTWINLLVNAAGQRGFRVLTVATRPPRSDPETGTVTAKETEREFGEAISKALAATKIETPNGIATLTPQALVFPAEVSRQLTGPNAPPVAHIPLPGWVWNLERRKQWQSALAHWRAIDNLVLLVELPPASVPESVLLAENLPQLIWLVDSGKPRTRATREQLETLRYAKCRLVGAVLNHEPKPVFEL